MAARRLHGLVYATIALCCVVIVVCSVALGTNQWFSSTGSPVQGTEGLKVQVSFGLFKGQKSKEGTGSIRKYGLKVVCSDAKCMFSCGRTGEQRKKDLDEILSGKTPLEAEICGEAETKMLNEERQSSGAELNPEFLNFGLYIITIVFLGLAILFSALGGGLALYNTYRTPIQPVLSVFGLYIWNGISAACVLLAMIMFGVTYSTVLKKNAIVSDTLTGQYTSDGQGSLGISYWILVLAIFANLANIGILRWRSWKIVKMEEKNVKVMSEKLESGDILLF